MKKTLSLVLLLLSGCAVVRQDIRTEERDTNGTLIVRSTHSTAYTVFESKQTLSKIRASNGKTQSIGVADLSQEASSTNLVKIIEGLAGLAASMAK